MKRVREVRCHLSKAKDFLKAVLHQQRGSYTQS